MITIQSAMLVALGFLAASLFALLVAPAFWARAVRLTTRRIKDTMPLSDIEIRADKDRIRAEYAIKVHKLESEMEQVRLAGARQQIEINRRDASINELEGELDKLKSVHEEAQNARRVLEQTVSDRLPRVEQRLNEAKKLLFTRDREIIELQRTADKHVHALNEASQINNQQQAEVDRLNQALTTRGGLAAADDRSSDVALRSELEALRAKTREQAQLLARLQSLSGRTPSIVQAAEAGDADRPGLGAPGDAGRGGDAAPSLLAQQVDLERQLRSLKARNEDQSAEIVRLKTALSVLENETDSDGKTSLRESRIGLKARLQALEAQSEQQSETIHKLRTELAAANERLARQATHFTNELKRLGAGGTSATGGRRQGEAARSSLTERVVNARIGGAAPAASNVEVFPVPKAAEAAGEGEAAAQAGLNGHHEDADEAVAAAGSEAAGAAPEAGAARNAGADPDADTSAVPAKADADRRPRLLDRLAGLARSP